MSKELEALKTIKIKCHPNSNPSPIVDEALEIIEQALIKAQKQEKKIAKYEMLKKALKEGIYVIDLPNENKLKYIPTLTLSNIGTEWYLSNHCDFCVNVRDYKELFWFKEDKSE